jgi:hypothetical protein
MFRMLIQDTLIALALQPQLYRFAPLVALSVALLFAGCKAHRLQSRPELTLEDMARSYVRLAVALGEHDGDSIDYYYGPPEWVADIRKAAPPLSEIRQSSLELIGSLRTMPVHDAMRATRRDFLIAQAEAIACRALFLSGAHSTFDEETQCSFGVTSPSTFNERALAATRAEIAGLVGGHGILADRYAAFDAKFIVPPNRVKAVIERALQGCREQTLKHIPLPADEKIELTLAGNEPWSGYSLYKGAHKSVVTINTDFPLTVDRLLDLACHEAYPGHHTFNMTRDDEVVQRAGAAELAVQPTYSPQSFLSEGAAAIASQIAFSPSERVHFEREKLFPIAGLPTTQVDRYLKVEALVDQLHSAIPVIERQYLNGNLEFARAGSALEQQALMNQTFETLKYINEFRSYVVAYTYSPDLLLRSLPEWGSPDAENRRWAMYSHWMRTESSLSDSVH